jgi:hypothetical protein
MDRHPVYKEERERMLFKSLGIWELLIILAVCGLPLLAIATAAVVGVFIAKRSRRKCPYCAELIRREARVCRFCGREIAPPTE